jgi:hypothetical protein
MQYVYPCCFYSVMLDAAHAHLLLLPPLLLLLLLFSAPVCR